MIRVNESSMSSGVVVNEIVSISGFTISSPLSRF
jgi:hypothetical protein